ncbi:MAG: DUF4876 domain-containing protein [Bacteroidales bacterium]|nr:DUF4876 domain-containing protein [Bacteroidales bacterium]
MKKFLCIFTIVLAASCADLQSTNPYAGNLNVLKVTADWPSDDFVCEGATVRVEDMNLGSTYYLLTDASGTVTFTLPNGLYRVTMSGRSGGDMFNASADKVVLSGQDRTLVMNLAVSKAGSLVIKELYCGGCKKLPQEGDYQADQYFILHNNHYEVQYLDGLCFGTLSPYNSTSSNPWISYDSQTGESVLPDFVPLIQAVWQFPGDGDDFPLMPGEDAVVCLRGAIDHAAQYPLSVNLNKPGYFVCYNATYFPNTLFHPAPGDQISVDRYLDVVIKTGKANAYTVSNSSPTLVIFRPEGISIHDFVLATDNVIPVPGSTVDNVVKIPSEWVLDAVEVFDARSSNNQKRLLPTLDAGYVLQTDVFLGRSLMRNVDETASEISGYEVLVDTNNSLNDFYETERQSLHE